MERACGWFSGNVLIRSWQEVAPEHLRRKWVDVCASVLRDDGVVVIHQFMPTLGAYFQGKEWRPERRKWFFDFPPFRVEIFKKCRTNGA